MGVLFDDSLELTLNKPAVELAVTGNFDDVKQQLKAISDKAATFVVTESNIAQAKSMQRWLAHLRISIDKQRKDWKNLYIKTPEKLLDLACSELQDIIATGEKVIATQLDAFDQKRIDELTELITGYIDDTASQLKLRDEFKQLIVIKKSYYNKTANEAETIADIEAQGKEALKKQNEYDSAVAFIQNELSGSSLSAGVYIQLLQYKSLAEVLTQIKADKAAAEQQAVEQQTVEQQTAEQQPVVEAKVEKPATEATGMKTLTLAFAYDSRDRDVLNRAYKEFVDALRTNCKYSYKVSIL